MTINSAADHGYTTQPAPRTVRNGDVIRLRCALGVYEVRVTRTTWREVDWRDTVFVRWVTEVPEFRQGFVGSIETHPYAKLLAAKYAD